MTPEEIAEHEREVAKLYEQYERDAQSEDWIAIVGPAKAGKTTLWVLLTGQTPSSIDDIVGVQIDKTVKKNTYSAGAKSIDDLPGFGTAKFSAKNYVKKMDLQKVHVFVCVFETGLRDEDIKVFKELEATGKPCLYVRSKCDNLKPPPFSRKTRDVLEAEVRTDVERLLGGPRTVYFTSSTDNTGIEELQNAIADALEDAQDQAKKDRWLLAMRAYSAEALKKKYDALHIRLCWVAGSASALNQVPSVNKIPGLTTFVNIGLMMDYFNRIRNAYDLADPEGVSAKLREVVDAKLIEHLTTELAVKHGEHLTEHAVQPMLKDLFKKIRDSATGAASDSARAWVDDLLNTYTQGMTRDGIMQLFSEYAASQTARTIVAWVPLIGRVLSSLIGARIIYSSGKKYLHTIDSISLFLLEAELLKREYTGA